MQEKSKPVDNLRADAEKIITRAIAAVLPVIFLIVAVLVSLTTGMRMVEEQAESAPGRKGPLGRWRTPPARVCRIISAAVWS